METKKLFLYVLVLFGVLFIGWSLFQEKEIQSITTEELEERLENRKSSDHTMYIDVREQEEYFAGHIEGMVNIPLSTLKTNTPSIADNIEIVIICRSGSRSMEAAEIFKERGYEKIVNVEGGMLSWQGEIVVP
ncbi:rhodanese-related sulfurtransferase [Salirhabdus euzebyi]|uniref:Rhodanese-related sulfurtransferase n=1 Tax=Salirhabdus euzebyi TaxID=394506 RepID=A0A841Q422_9BACI|nr:rhodanese-like domain-containing protein [Salirhabdus euzebyi]MBB6453156.1 rhodanese-related sulfurtransferase [Salirhabdus euzebyi]